jgi:hypothetical protein
MRQPVLGRVESTPAQVLASPMGERESGGKSIYEKLGWEEEYEELC